MVAIRIILERIIDIPVNILTPKAHQVHFESELPDEVETFNTVSLNGNFY